MTRLQSLVDGLARWGRAPGLNFRTEYREFRSDYADLDRSIRQIATYYVNNEIRAGDRVALWAPNSPTWVAALLAALAMGIAVVPLDLHSTPEFVSKVLDETNSRLLVADIHPLTSVNTTHSISIARLAWEASRLDPTSDPWPTINESTLAEIVYTSGTTASPRGVLVTHGNLGASLEAIEPIVPAEPAYRFLSLLPLSHLFEQVIGLFLPLSRGGQITYIESLKPSAIEDALRAERPNVLVAVPRILELLKTRIERALGEEGAVTLAKMIPFLRLLPRSIRRVVTYPIRRRLSPALKYVVVGGAPLDRQIEQFWDALGFVVLQGYGLTEAAPVVSANTPRHHRLGSVGHPVRGVDVTLDRDGEILVRGPNVTPGYYCRPELNASAFVDGYFRTGDIGAFDRAGYLSILGRKKDVIVTSAGLKVFPEDVEAAIDRVEGVRDSTVLEWQGNVHAVLLLDAQHHPPPGEIVNRANARLNSVQRITSWTVWPTADFPRTPTLKIQKYRVRETLSTIAEPAASPMAPASRVQQIVSGVARGQTIRSDSRLGSDLGLSSVDRLELIVALEEEFRIDLPESSVTGETTAGELDELVRRGERRPSFRPRRWTLASITVAFRDFLQRRVIFPVFRILFPVSVQGCEALDGLSGPVILAGNHVSHLDGPLVLEVLPEPVRRRTAVAALAGFYFPPATNPFLRAWQSLIFNAASLLYNVFPVPRERGFRESLRYAGYLVDRKWNVLIFPEGTRSATGDMVPFRDGIGLLASELKVPIVPFRIRGTEKIQPRGAWIPIPGRVQIHFGPPMEFPPMPYSEITRQIQAAVAAL